MLISDSNTAYKKFLNNYNIIKAIKRVQLSSQWQDKPKLS